MKEVHIRERQIKSGKMYEYRFEIAGIDGKRKFITKGGFKSKTEAKEAGKKAQQEYEQHGTIKKNEDLSVADLMSKWLENADIKPTTKAGYEKKIRNYINPVIGSYRAISIDYNILQNDIIDDLYKRGFSRNTISSVAGILSQAFIFGANTLKIPKRFESLTIPKYKDKETPTREEPHIYITKEQFKSIIERFPEGTTAFLPLLIGYSCGLRLGETFALCWSDIDLENKTININKQVQWLQFAKAGTVGRGGIKRDSTEYGYWYFTNPKYNSKRIIDILDENIVELLRREKERQEKAKAYYLSMGNLVYNSKGKIIGKTFTQYYESLYEGKQIITTDKTDKPLDLVFVREDGTYISQRIMMHTTSVIKKQIGIDEFDYHSLRHTHATDLCDRIDEEGIDSTGKKITPVYVQKRLGHRNLQTTLNIYYHLTEEKRKREAAKLNDMYSDLF